MKNKRSRIIILALAAVLLILVLAGAVVASISQFDLDVPNLRFARNVADIKAQAEAQGDPVVARVADFDITLSSLETRSQMNLQLSTAQPSVPEAYSRGLRTIVRRVIAYQDAERRELSVSDEEVETYLREQQELHESLPEETKQIIAEHNTILDFTAEDRRVEAEYTLLWNKHYQQVVAEAPSLTEADVIAFIRENAPNYLQLMMIELDDMQAAEQIYDILQNVEPDLRSEKFFEIASAENDVKGPENPEEMIQHFEFIEADELPNYAQTALGNGQGSVGLSQQDQQSVILFLHLTSVHHELEQLKKMVEADLAQPNQYDYFQGYINQLIVEADIEIYHDVLPDVMGPVSINDFVR